MIYALKENDRSEGYFCPRMEINQLIWNLKIKEFDKLGLLLLHLEIKSKSLPSLTLEKQAEVLRDKLTYLDEDFSLVEHDRSTHTIILRSDLPHRIENTVNYYEIVLKGGHELSFGRYEFDKGAGKRQICPANLSRVAFERLLADFEALLS